MSQLNWEAVTGELIGWQEIVLLPHTRAGTPKLRRHTLTFFTPLATDLGYKKMLHLYVFTMRFHLILRSRACEHRVRICLDRVGLPELHQFTVVGARLCYMQVPISRT